MNIDAATPALRDEARADDSGGEVRSRWLVRLRWGSVAGQILIILASRRSAQLSEAMPVLLGLALVMGATNLGLWLWVRERRVVSVGWSGATLAFDMIQLTALLQFSGGASNPLSVFYLVEITAAAVTLGSRWTWFLTLLGVSGYAALFAMPMTSPGAAMEMGSDGAAFGRHLQLMWAALTLSAVLTAFFVTRLTTSLAERDREIGLMRDTAARLERVAALTTLAAGAAHELGTPLTTMAVVAGELERAMTSLPPEQSNRFGDDVRLIRAEVQRCRDILDEMRRRSGGAVGEMPTTFTVEALAQELSARLQPPSVARCSMATVGGDVSMFLPRRALIRVVLSLIQNALDASAPLQEITIEFDAGDVLQIRVRDHGAGMAADVLRRAAEPFFTTKPPGQGLGLGLFLARNFAEQLGGRLDIESAPVSGTTAHLVLPLRVDVDAQHS